MIWLFFACHNNIVRFIQHGFETPHISCRPLVSAYTSLWGKGKTLRTNIFKSVPLVLAADSDPAATTTTDGTERFTVMDLSLLGIDLNAFHHKPGMSGMIIREEYELAESALKRYRKTDSGVGGMSILGQPGIGETDCYVVFPFPDCLQPRKIVFLDVYTGPQPFGGQADFLSSGARNRISVLRSRSLQLRSCALERS